MELCCLFLVVNETVAVVVGGVVGLAFDALHCPVFLSFCDFGVKTLKDAVRTMQGPLEVPPNFPVPSWSKESLP